MPPPRRKPKLITLPTPNGIKHWELSYKARMKQWGTCDNPDDGTKTPQICISSAAKGKTKLDALLHELIHASFGMNATREEFVTEVATAWTTILWEEGLRWEV